MAYCKGDVGRDVDALQMRKYHNPPTGCLYRSLGHGATEGVVQRGH